MIRIIRPGYYARMAKLHKSSVLARHLGRLVEFECKKLLAVAIRSQPDVAFSSRAVYNPN